MQTTGGLPGRIDPIVILEDTRKEGHGRGPYFKCVRVLQTTKSEKTDPYHQKQNHEEDCGPTAAKDFDLCSELALP